MDDGTAVVFYVVYVSRTSMELGVGYVHVVGIEPSYLREYMQCDSEHARACAVRSAFHLHGVTVIFNTARPLPAYFELGGLTPAHIRYAAVT